MQKFLCKIGCALQRELTNMLILAVWGLYLFALLGGKMQGNAVYTLRQCVTFGFFVLGAGWNTLWGTLTFALWRRHRCPRSG